MSVCGISHKDEKVMSLNPSIKFSQLFHLADIHLPWHSSTELTATKVRSFPKCFGTNYILIGLKLLTLQSFGLRTL